MWRETSESKELTADIDLRTVTRHEATASWLTTGVTLAALLAVGVLVHAVRTTPVLQSPTSVEWANYHSEAQATIDQAYVNRDCRTLQHWLTEAAESDSAVRASGGDGSLDLIRYVDTALDLANC